MEPRSIIYSLIILCFLQVSLSSCGEDDLKTAAKLKGRVSMSSDTTRSVDITYSDSAKVKAQGFAPVLVKVVPANGGSFQEMPKGIKINFLDPLANVKGSITSDYAIMKDLEKTATFLRNVVVVNEKLTYNTEELVWDQTKKLFTSPKGVITKPDGTVLSAVNFTATEDFSTVTWENGTGEVYVPDNYGQ
ncbi:hypothetical protein [Pedobacter sp. JCM 36344]|uniref:hypothetical protein n=1 Tax=Pedobacter sp. JCM 36344 TaxID=3374280 RepID=UPI00397BF918